MLSNTRSVGVENLSTSVFVHLCVREMSVFMQVLSYVTVMCTVQERQCHFQRMFVGCAFDMGCDCQTDTEEHLLE